MTKVLVFPRKYEMNFCFEAIPLYLAHLVTIGGEINGPQSASVTSFTFFNFCEDAEPWPFSFLLRGLEADTGLGEAGSEHGEQRNGTGLAQSGAKTESIPPWLR